MKATGVLFLSGRPCLVHGDSPTEGHVIDWSFACFDRRDGRRGLQRVRVFWRGVDAAKFVAAHAARLVAGQALALELDRLVPLGDTIEARVVSCDLAPDRWPRAADPSPSFPQPSGPGLINPETQKKCPTC